MFQTTSLQDSARMGCHQRCLWVFFHGSWPTRSDWDPAHRSPKTWQLSCHSYSELLRCVEIWRGATWSNMQQLSFLFVFLCLTGCFGFSWFPSASVHGPHGPHGPHGHRLKLSMAFCRSASEVASTGDPFPPSNSSDGDMLIIRSGYMLCLISMLDVWQ